MERLTSNTQLTAEQQSALDRGNLNLPPERMSYLQGFSREFGNKTPAEIKAIMDRSGADGSKVADAFQLASNSNIHTGLPETEPPSIDNPSSGGKYALPEGVQKVLDGPAMTQPMSSGVFQDGRWIVPPEPTGPLQPTPGLNDLANIVQQGDRGLQHGTALDAGLMAKSQEMLDISNQHSQLAPTDDAPRWYHDNVDPTLQNMLNAVNADDMVIHDAVTGPGSEHFLNDLTNHQWQDDGLAAGGLFDWVGEEAANDPNAEQPKPRTPWPSTPAAITPICSTSKAPGAMGQRGSRWARSIPNSRGIGRARSRHTSMTWWATTPAATTASSHHWTQQTAPRPNQPTPEI